MFVNFNKEVCLKLTMTNIKNYNKEIIDSYYDNFLLNILNYKKVKLNTKNKNCKLYVSFK